GGIYDQLAGGFSRYSVDGDWVVPHFEKMLYDNALLLRAYTSWYRTTGSQLAHRVVTETAQFLLRDLRAGDGFASSLDADADGVEGSTYVWTPAQLAEVAKHLGQLCGTYAPAMVSPPPWTLTPTAWKAVPTCGLPRSWPRCSATMTAPGRPSCWASP